MADVRDILINLLGRETVSPAAKKAADGVEKLGDRMDATADDAKRLDAEIKQAERGLQDLAVQFARSQDAAERLDLSKAMRKQQSEIRRLGKAKDLLPGVEMGAELAGQVSMSFVQRLGPLIARAPMAGMNPAALAIGAPLALGVAATVSAALAGAVTGAAGAGGVIGGLVIASRHAAVKSAAKQTGDTFSTIMESAGVAFVPAAVQALGQVRSELGNMEDDFERLFAASSQFVKPLTGGVLAGASRALEGMATAAERAGPVMHSLSWIAERFGDLVGDSFEQLSEHADTGARALAMLWAVFEVGVRSVVGTIDALATVYGWMEKLGALLTRDVAQFVNLATAEERAKDAGVELSPALRDLLGGFTGAGDAAAAATPKIQTFADVVAESTGRALTSEQANLRLEDAIDRAADAAKNNGDGIDKNIPKQRANRDALLGIAQAAQAARATILEQTGSQELASKATERGRAEFLKTAAAMGVSKKEAKELADRLFGIPEKRKTDVDVKVKQTPIDLKTVAGRIAAIKSKRVVITVVNNTVTTRSEGRNVGIGDGVGGRASGGPISAGTPYVVGEEGAELIVPARDGFVFDAKKTAALRAALGAGGSAMAGSRGGWAGSQTAVHNTYHITVNVPATANAAEVGRVTVQAIQAYEKRSGKAWRST